MPEAFGDVTEEERRRFGRVLDDYYAYVDALVGEALASSASRTICCWSCPVRDGAAHRWQARCSNELLGDPRFSGTHERAPGRIPARIRHAGQPRPPRARSVVDVAPTLLYFLGLPVAATWMGSRAPTSFTPTFTDERADHVHPDYVTGKTCASELQGVQLSRADNPNRHLVLNRGPDV